MNTDILISERDIADQRNTSDSDPCAVIADNSPVETIVSTRSNRQLYYLAMAHFFSQLSRFPVDDKNRHD